MDKARKDMYLALETAHWCLKTNYENTVQSIQVKLLNHLLYSQTPGDDLQDIRYKGETSERPKEGEFMSGCFEISMPGEE